MDYEKASAFEKKLERAEEYRERTEKQQKFADKHPILSSVGSVLASPLQGAEYFDSLLSNWGHNDPDDPDSYIPLDVTEMYATNFVRNVRGTVAKKIEENPAFAGAEIGGQNVGAFLYQTGMSMGDFLFNALITGSLGGEKLPGKAGAKIAANLSLAIMGTSAAADATISAKDRGLSDDKSFALGTIAGMAEILTERFSLEALLEGKWEENAIKYILKNAFTEGSEEVASSLINHFADLLIAGDQSEWRQAVAGYMDQGMTEQEAFEAACMDMAESLGADFLGGFFSGGVLSTGNATLNMALKRAYEGQITSDVAEKVLADPEAVRELGVTITADMTPAQQMAAVKRRLRQITADEQTVGKEKTASVEKAGAVKADGESYTVVKRLRENIPVLADMGPVASVSTQEVRRTENGQTMAGIARKLFDDIKGIVSRKGFGNVEINQRSVKDDLSHGIGPAKAAVISAIPAVIQNGKQIDFQEKWKGREYDGYVFAAPVTMDGDTVYVAAVVKRTSKNRFYLHEVVDSNGNIIKIDSGDGATQTSLATESGAGTPPPLSTDPIIPAVEDGVKGKFAPEDGAPEGGEAHYMLEDTAQAYEEKDLSKDGSVYGYEFLTSLPDMTVTSLPEVGEVRGKDGKINARTAVNLGMMNARKVGMEKDGKVLVRNGYTGKQLCVTPNSIRHGLNGDYRRLMTNARLGSVIGDLVKNAVPVNALQNKAEGVTGTYAMAGYARDSRGREFIGIITVEQKTGTVESIEVYDTFHSVSGRQKKSGSQVDTKSQSIHSIKATTISIADLLETVKSTHQSILSEDVLNHFGEKRNPKGDYTGKALFSIKDAEAATQTATGEGEAGPTRFLTQADAKHFASETGTENGLILDDYVQKHLRPEKAKQLNTLAKALGVRVRFVGSIRGGTANASIRGNEVQIERYNPNPVTFLLGHELTHRMQQLSPEAYARFKEAVRSEAEKEAQGLYTLYQNRGEKIDFEGAMDEATANYAGRLLEKGPVLDEFIQRHKTDRSLLEKLLDAVRDILSKLTGTERKQAETAESKLLEALEETAEKVKKNGGEVVTADSGETKYSFKGYDAETGRGIYESNFPIGTPKTEKGKRILNFVQNVWSKAPLKLTIEENGAKKTIYAQFDPTYSEDKKVKTDLSKLMGGNRHGTAMEKRVTLDLADDYYQIAQEASYNYSKKEVGKTSATHEGVTQWHYFINDILFQEFGSNETVPFRVTINVKEKPDGSYIYSYNAERQN